MDVGIDIGSRTIKVVALQDGEIVHQQVVAGSYNPAAQARELLRSLAPRRLVKTGYGRHLEVEGAAVVVRAITEIKAHAIGARYHYPAAATILDVGGQDSKVISLNAAGGVASFHMNDKCAAGTGRFLEMMAVSLGCELDDFATLAAGGGADLTINSMCAVFAESEVVSLKHAGHSAADIAAAVHRAVAARLVAMLRRGHGGEPLVFTGGVARNHFMLHCLQQEMGGQLLVPPHPDTTGALGAALYAARLSTGV